MDNFTNFQLEMPNCRNGNTFTQISTLAAAYHLGNTSSCMITHVKLHRACSKYLNGRLFKWYLSTAVSPRTHTMAVLSILPCSGCGRCQAGYCKHRRWTSLAPQNSGRTQEGKNMFFISSSQISINVR